MLPDFFLFRFVFKSFCFCQKNYYVVLVDLERRKIVGMIEKRTKKEITEYLEAWGKEVLSKIQEISIDQRIAL